MLLKTTTSNNSLFQALSWKGRDETRRDGTKEYNGLGKKNKIKQERTSFANAAILHIPTN